MFSLRSAKAASIALLLSLPLLNAQEFNFPNCVNQCIDQSTDDSCSLADLKCICRQSNGRFLPDVVVCVKMACETTVDVQALLGPMEFVCRLIGTPVSEQALDNARNIFTADTVTKTVYSSVMPGPTGIETVTEEEDDDTTATRDPNEPLTITETRDGSESPTPEPEEQAEPDVAVVIVITTDEEGATQTSTYTTETTIQTGEQTETDDATITETLESTPTSSRQPRTTTVTQGAGGGGGGPFNDNNTPDGEASRGSIPTIWALSLALVFTYLLA